MSPLNTQKENVTCCDYCINKYMHTTSQNVPDLYEGGTKIHICPAQGFSTDEPNECQGCHIMG